MVEDPADYVWSSYQINALGRASELCTPHPEYLSLGREKASRLKRYRSLFKANVEDELLSEIRSGINKGLALGNDRFKDEIEQLTGRRVSPNNAGRPVGWRKAKSKRA